MMRKATLGLQSASFWRRSIVLSFLFALIMLFSTCNMFESDDDNTLQILSLGWLLQQRAECSDDSGMVICIPPGFVLD